MRRYLLLLFLVLSFCFTSAAEARKLALLVGVAEYVDAPSLGCCVNDMKALKAALVNIGFQESDIIILTTGGTVRDVPSKRNIERKLSEILSKAQSTDMLFIAFSGHGAQEGKNAYFCPPDVELNNLEGTAVSFNKIMDNLAKCKARSKLMVVDACLSDMNQVLVAGKELRSIPAPPPGIALFQSCAEGEVSYEENRAGGHSYFMKNLAAALSGEADSDHDGKLTLMEVCIWTTVQTKEQVQNSNNKTQRPYLRGSIMDFTLIENVNISKAKVLVSEARKAVKEENYELAIEKYDAAIALCPQYSSIKRERDIAQTLLEKRRLTSNGGNSASSVNLQTSQSNLQTSQSSNSYKRKLALLVGVDDYSRVSKLTCCVNDMKTLKEALMKIGFEEDNIQMLVTGVSEFDKLPTKGNIEWGISKMLSNIQPSDMVLIAFSGHGAQEGKNVYFCPPEVDLENLAGTCVSINKVMDDLEKCKAKFKWMVVDACRNDPTQGAKGIGSKGLRVIHTQSAGFTLIQSCAEGEESWEDRYTGNSFFTKNFAAALSGAADSDHDGKLTLMEVYKWTSAKTKEQVRNSLNKTQIPFISGSLSDITLTEDLNVQKAQVIIEEARKAMDDDNYELAVKKFNEAIALCPKNKSWKRERDNAQKFLQAQQKIRELEAKTRTKP